MRRLPHALEVERDEGADLALGVGDGIGAKLDRLSGGELARFDGAGKSQVPTASGGAARCGS